MPVPMPVISAKQFIELVNLRLPSHHAFKAGMHVFLVRPAFVNADPIEFDFSPRTGRTSGVVNYVADHVKSEFMVEPELKLAGSG
ncbi:hypothetical protein [Burkholderia oklahomensis]|uniref:Uncharacterized protein n=1 Tax=Burkholderia oklahomensis TaxID=342113 RepID=A0AAI8FQE8_9BURK|nr:hypothetical protein [Burkholderia oklahomensis]AIO68900.1 hypothetical protein DM82_5683 [Burkholderia oklahomensis]AJX35383.1 hypothetical protein BG90_4949 [Burkholderia oklahomensis C6786]AOI38954.1 hypothetical protein WG70_04520 [Burkholderia oklahomensis EO147]AOI48656.1 hypothetical protein WI23_22705 [Burkholderia oklahomensis C6786]KUY47442.1 hypothetical protein WI23_29655 [Burkholderia oklahomensis C6786]